MRTIIPLCLFCVFFCSEAIEDTKFRRFYLPIYNRHFDKLRYYNNHTSLTPEGVHLGCPAHCKALQGNNKCDAHWGCDIPECLHDLGDCRLNTPCFPGSTHCPNDGVCRIRCELDGCGHGACTLDRRTEREYMLLAIPRIHPQKFFEKFETVEEKMFKELGFRVSLESYRDGPMMWRFNKDTEVPSRIFYADEYRETIQMNPSDYENRTLVMMSINAPYLVTKAMKQFDTLERLGTPFYRADVMLMMLPHNTTSGFSEYYAKPARNRQSSDKYFEKKRRNQQIKNGDILG